MQLRQLGSNQSSLNFADGKEIFFSYETPVAAYLPSKGYVKTSQKWSRTTSRHINNFSTAYVCEYPQEFFNSLIDENWENAKSGILRNFTFFHFLRIVILTVFCYNY